MVTFHLASLACETSMTNDDLAAAAAARLADAGVDMWRMHRRRSTIVDDR